jgi:hypothetical protein
MLRRAASSVCVGEGGVRGRGDGRPVAASPAGIGAGRCVRSGRHRARATAQTEGQDLAPRAARCVRTTCGCGAGGSGTATPAALTPTGPGSPTGAKGRRLASWRRAHRHPPEERRPKGGRQGQSECGAARPAPDSRRRGEHTHSAVIETWTVFGRLGSATMPSTTRLILRLVRLANPVRGEASARDVCRTPRSPRVDAHARRSRANIGPCSNDQRTVCMGTRAEKGQQRHASRSDRDPRGSTRPGASRTLAPSIHHVRSIT